MDLKNIDLKNINIEDLKAKLQNVDKKTLIKFGSGFAAILIFLIGYYAILSPIVNEKKEKYNTKPVQNDRHPQQILSYKVIVSPRYTYIISTILSLSSLSG